MVHLDQENSILAFPPVKGVERLLTSTDFTFKGFFLGVDSHMNLEAVGGEEGLATARQFADESVLP